MFRYTDQIEREAKLLHHLWQIHPHFIEKTKCSVVKKSEGKDKKLNGGKHNKVKKTMPEEQKFLNVIAEKMEHLGC